jgi:hypothetical protein
MSTSKGGGKGKAASDKHIPGQQYGPDGEVLTAKQRKTINKMYKMDDITSGNVQLRTEGLTAALRRGLIHDVEEAVVDHASSSMSHIDPHNHHIAPNDDTSMDVVSSEAINLTDDLIFPSPSSSGMDINKLRGAAEATTINQMSDVNGMVESLPPLRSNVQNYVIGDVQAAELLLHGSRYPCLYCHDKITKEVMKWPDSFDTQMGEFKDAWGGWHPACLKTDIRRQNLPNSGEVMKMVNLFGWRVLGIDMSQLGFAPDLTDLRIFGGTLTMEEFHVSSGVELCRRVPTSAFWRAGPILHEIQTLVDKKYTAAQQLLREVRRSQQVTDEQCRAAMLKFPNHIVTSNTDPSIIFDTQKNEWVDVHALSDEFSSSSTMVNLIPKFAPSQWRGQIPTYSATTMTPKQFASAATGATSSKRK